jgi:hypothetical protein
MRFQVGDNFSGLEAALALPAVFCRGRREDCYPFLVFQKARPGALQIGDNFSGLEAALVFGSE